MKKGRFVLYMICVLSFGLVIGIFCGRNMRGEYVQLPANDPFPYESTTSRRIDYRLDLNTATQTQLMELPGIGETLAQRILEYRDKNGPFTMVEELLNVPGIGEGKLKQIEEHIKIGE